ncbi:sugar ABC transporter permease [Phytoactinopolyspora mesophila]
MTKTSVLEASEVPVEQTSIRSSLRGYFSRVRGGEVGALPAILGLLSLMVFFTAMNPNRFASLLNFANLLNQSAAIIFIAMGLVFVLLLGEIDLSAGVAAGASGAVLAVLMTHHGVAWPLALAACLLAGAVIGLTIGLIVSRLGVPSFVVTLAYFLGLQGMMLWVIGEGGTIPVRSDTILSIMKSNVAPALGWVFTILVVSGYAAVTLSGARKRKRRGLPVQPPSILGFKIGAFAVLAGVGTHLLNQERSVNPELTSLKGMPYIVPITTVILVGLTFVLSRTAFGRHIYAIGGSVEAARRAGINVGRVKVICFIICSTMAASAGVLFASRDNSISPSTGGSITLLLAVGAAVIGGASLFGGKGKVRDAVLGGLVVATIANGLPLITSASSVQFIVTALVLLLAAAVDALSRRRAAATGHA